MEYPQDSLVPQSEDESSQEPTNDTDNPQIPRSDEDILAEAHKRMELAEEAESEIRKQALDDLEFRVGKQWPDNLQQERERDGRPCLVINRLPQFIQQVANDQRQNRPSIKVHPLDDQADIETAKVISGLIRHIEYNSNAETAYDTAFESAATGGFGYFRILTEFTDPDSFDQELVIKRIRNPFSVFFDPFSQECDGSDANWAFIVDDLSPEEYRNKYPDSQLAAPGSDWRAIGDTQPAWMKSDTVRVAEYFYREFTPTVIHLLNTGETVRDDELQSRLSAAAAAGIQSQVVRSRETKIETICWLKINAVEILEKTTWPGKYIPIIPVYGAEVFVDGKRTLESVIRNAKGAQRMYNYWASAETETIALAPRTPFIVAEGQIEGYEDQWKTANRRNHAYLPYKPTSVAGMPVQPPQRQAFEPAVQAITGARMLAADDLKSTTGIYDSAVGAQSNEVSGVAIQSRAGQSQAATFHFVDNMTRSQKHAGRILVDLIPEIYDTERAIRIIGDDGDHSVVKINKPFDKDGKQVIYSLDTGRYGVTIDTGPNFASKRQESAASMMELSRVYPQIMQIAGDLLVKNMDWPGAQEIADRIKMTLPPGIQANAGKSQQIPPQAFAQMQQMHQMIGQLSQHLNQANQIIEQKQIESQMLDKELSHKERVEMAKIQADAEIQMAKLGSNEAIVLLKQEIASITERLKLSGIDQPMDTGQPQYSQPMPDVGAADPFGQQAGQTPTGGMSPGTPMGG